MSSQSSRRRVSVPISLPRASRLHRLVRLLGDAPRRRDELLTGLRIGLRTFYRELELLQKIGVKVDREGKNYRLRGSLETAETRLPFPDPGLSFAEMAELSRHPGPTAARLAELLATVVGAEPAAPKPTAAKGKRKTRPSTD